MLFRTRMNAEAVLAAAALFAAGAGITESLQAGEPSEPRHITVTNEALPFETTLTLAKGDVARLALPNGKDVAFWCRAGSLLDESGLALEWGEKAFKQLEITWRKMPDGSRVAAGWNSYIRQGSVGTSSRTRGTERELFVEQYRIVLKDAGETKGTLPVTVQVRIATKKEMLFGDAEREYYLTQLRSDKPGERLDAIRELQAMVALGSMYAGDLRRIADTIRPLTKDSDTQVKSAAENALAVVGDEQTLVALVTPEPQGRWRSESGARTLASWYMQNKPEAMIKHVLTLFDSKDDSLVLFAATFCAVVQDPRTKPNLLAALKNPSPAVRCQAVDALRFVCTPEEAAKHMVALLKDSAKEVVLAVLREASWLNREIPSKEITSFLTHVDPEVRRMAAYALDCCPNPEVVDPLLAATKDAEARVRAQAAVTLGRIATPKAYNRLVEMLADENPEVRVEAINGLRWLRDRRAIEQIQKLLENEKNQDVKNMADRTIRELKLY